MRWIALDITWGSSQWLSVLSAECRLTWVELLCYVKGSGTDGRVRSMAAARFARMIYVGEESVIQLLKAAETHGALRLEDGDWVITKWRDYQYASSSTPRVQKHREAKKNTSQVQGNVSETDVTLRNVSETDVTLDNDIDNDNDKKPPIVPQGGFDKFWETYPKRKGGSPKEKARQAFAKAIRGGATVEEVVAGVEGWKRANPDKIGTEFVPMPATWLNQKRWADDYDDVEPLYLPGEDVTRRVRNA